MFMFDRFIGNERAKEILRRMLTQRRIPGALLLVGEEGLGKKLFALELAKAANCRAPRGVEACDECPSCLRIVKFELPSADDRDAHKKIIWSEHRDVGMVRPYNRSILVEAARDLERETNYRPVEGRARFFLIDHAELLSDASSNALLKTLEEVQPTSHLLLLTARPASLLPTIRSRCQTVRFAPLPPAEVEAFLVSTRQRAGKEARLAARLAGGRPGHALRLNLDTYREQREEMFDLLDALTTSDRARLLRAAEDLSDAKRKDEYEPRLEVLEILIHDLWLLTLAPSEAALTNDDLRERLTSLSTRVAPRRAARWLGRVEELRSQLAVNVNRRVATDALLLSMAAD
ncbi:MAG TPA: DNA polymerase III subunit delta' [Pyrinomonadaceae bacterium]|nr:DNA polymerase III subunit delta' [Pyrinomonadaceae bacterium]